MERVDSSLALRCTQRLPVPSDILLAWLASHTWFLPCIPQPTQPVPPLPRLTHQEPGCCPSRGAPSLGPLSA